MQPLTQRQREVLDFITNFVAKNAFNPSYEEIAVAMNLASLATVSKHIDILEAKGFVRRNGKRSRCLELIGPARFAIIKSGGDWTNATATALAIPTGMDLKAQHISYQSWLRDEFHKPNPSGDPFPSIPFRTFPEWLRDHGARDTEESEVLEFWEK